MYGDCTGGHRKQPAEETIQLWLTRHGAVQYSTVQYSTVQPIYIRISWRRCTGLYEYNLMMGHSKDSCEHHCVDISLVSRYMQYLLPVASGATGQLSPGAGWAEAAACGLSSVLVITNYILTVLHLFCCLLYNHWFVSDLYFKDMVRIKYHL